MLDFVETRKQFYLPSLSKKPKSKTYLIFDVETDLVQVDKVTEQHIPKLICCKLITLDSDGTCHSGDMKFFYRVGDFQFYLYEQLNKYYTIYLLGHNSGYDISTARIFELIDDLNMKCVAFNPKMGSYYCHFTAQQCRLIIIDNYNWFAHPLAEIGDRLGFKKLKMPKTKQLTLKWIEYCMRDVEIVEKSMMELSKYLSRFSGGHLEITIASTAFTIFRKYFHQTNMLISTNLPAVNLEYESYFGGRNEMFLCGTLPKRMYYYYDFNSLYPSVMINNLYSTKLRRHFKTSSLEQLTRYLKNYGAVAKVSIKTKYPVVPKKMGTFTTFPIGEFDTVLSTPELKFCVKHNLITKVHNLSVYLQKDIFTEYIEYFHKMKQKHKKENKPIDTMFDKLMLNTLYGKMGQKINSLEKISDNHPRSYEIFDYVDFDKGVLEKHKVLNHVEYIEKPNLIGNYSIPIIASEVTSYARMKLLDVILKIGWDNIYYCDTDSVITNAKGQKIIKKLYEGNKLGDLELEKKSNYVELFALKDYNFGEDIRRKSIPKRAEKIADNVYEFIHFNTTIESLKSSKKDGMHTQKRRKKLSRKYSKGVVNQDGTITPITLQK